jgi:AmiR/NasT family two-component response regulator
VSACWKAPGYPPIGMNARDAVRQRHFVAVDDRDRVTGARELADQLEPDVAIAAGDQNAHRMSSPRVSRA